MVVNLDIVDKDFEDYVDGKARVQGDGAWK